MIPQAQASEGFENISFLVNWIDLNWKAETKGGRTVFMLADIFSSNVQNQTPKCKKDGDVVLKHDFLQGS